MTSSKKIIADSFTRNKECNIIGLAGTSNYPNAPIGWSDSVAKEDLKYNLIQAKSPKDTGHLVYQNTSQPLNQAVILDGFFFAIRRDAFQNFRWSNRIGRFHGYDYDVCLYQECRAPGHIFISGEIRVKHNSNGTAAGAWGAAVISIWSKYTLARNYYSPQNKPPKPDHFGVTNAKYLNIPKRSAFAALLKGCLLNVLKGRMSPKNCFIILRRGWINFS